MSTIITTNHFPFVCWWNKACVPYSWPLPRIIKTISKIDFWLYFSNSNITIKGISMLCIRIYISPERFKSIPFPIIQIHLWISQIIFFLIWSIEICQSTSILICPLPFIHLFLILSLTNIIKWIKIRRYSMFKSKNI